MFRKNSYFRILILNISNMTKKTVILLSVLMLSLASFAQTANLGEWWNDLSVFQVNKVAPRTNVIPYSDEDGVNRLAYSEFLLCQHSC